MFIGVIADDPTGGTNTGPEIAPSVSWMIAADGPPVVLVLKSGHFGQDDMFLKAWDLLS